MKNENLILKKIDIIDFINRLEYGSVMVKYDNEETRNYTHDCIVIFNTLNDGEYIEERIMSPEEVYDEIGAYNDSDKWYRILFKMRVVIGVTHISQGDVEIIKKAHIAKNDKCQMIIKMNFGLLKYAERLARRLGLKFISKEDYWIFNGEPRKESAFKIMQRANLEGRDKVEFDLQQYSSQTIRCYASNLSAEIGKKVSVTISNGKMVVRFKEAELKEVMAEEANLFYKKLCVKLGHDMAREIMESVIIDTEFDNIPLKVDFEETETPAEEFRYLGEIDVATPAEVFAAEPNAEAEAEEENTNFDYDSQGRKFLTPNERSPEYDDEDF